MITAVDTNVLIDILEPGALHAGESEGSPRKALSQGSVLISEPVYAELAAHFLSQEEPDRFIERFGIRFDRMSMAALRRAGVAWREYANQRPAGLSCQVCGTVAEPQCSSCSSTIRARQHVLADFLIGAHALAQADPLLTRDRGYYATYFPELTLA